MKTIAPGTLCPDRRHLLGHRLYVETRIWEFSAHWNTLQKRRLNPNWVRGKRCWAIAYG